MEVITDCYPHYASQVLSLLKSSTLLLGFSLYLQRNLSILLIKTYLLVKAIFPSRHTSWIGALGK